MYVYVCLFLSHTHSLSSLPYEDDGRHTQVRTYAYQKKKRTPSLPDSLSFF